MPTFHGIVDALPVKDPVLVFALAMLAILLAPLLVRRLKLPDLIGLILAGVLLGEHGLGILARDDTMILLGTVGLLYIVFLAGLEIDLHQFVVHRNKSLVFGLLTFAIPMTLGTISARGVLDYSWPAALLLASMFASHTLVAYPVASRLGILRNPAVTACIGGSIITDTLALLVLAVIAAGTTGSITAWFWIKTILSLIIFALIVTMGIPRLSRAYFHRLSDRGGRDFIFVLTVGFLTAYLAKIAGLEPIIGAFFAGLALNRSIPAQSSLMSRVHFAGHSFFVPFFLMSVGMLVDVRVLLSSSRIWLVGSTMVITVFAAKWLAAWTTRHLLGFSREEGLVMFGLSVTQAAATLAAVFVGYRIGLFGEEVLNGAIIMILFTCVIGPTVVERFGRSVARHEEMAPILAGETPLRILIPLANPTSAPALMDLAFIMRRPLSTEPVYPLTVADQSGDIARQVAIGERMLGQAVIYASGAGVPVQPVTRVDNNIANGISRALAELRISTVVIGWTGAPSRRRHALGTVLDQLLSENMQAILVCRLLHPLNATGRVILVIPPFVEREKGFGEAVRTVKLMATRIGARLHIVAVDDEVQRLEPALKRIRPTVPSTFNGATADALFEGGLEHVLPGRNDLIVLLSTRVGRLAWSPELGRLPLQLAEHHPGCNLVLFFPPEQDDPALSTSGALGLLDARRTVIGLPDMDFVSALCHLTAPHLRAPRAQEDIRATLQQNAQDFATEIAPGTVLVHAHGKQIDQAMLFMGTRREGIAIPGHSRPARVLLLLLSPEGWTAEEHLRFLAGLARMMRGRDLADRLSTATSFEELRDELADER